MQQTRYPQNNIPMNKQIFDYPQTLAPMNKYTCEEFMFPMVFIFDSVTSAQSFVSVPNYILSIVCLSINF